MATTVTWFRNVILRDLDTLGAQIRGYPSDASLWRHVDGITNPGGILIHHLCGNLRHFVGSCIGGSDFRRDRDAEFARRDITRAELQLMVAAAQAEVAAGFDRLEPIGLDERFPEPVGGATLVTGQFLVHLTAHFAYHLGQIDYHRRVATGGGPVPGMQSALALVER